LLAQYWCKIDKWDQETLSTKWPFLFTFVKDQSQSVHDVLTIVDTTSLFHLPLSVEAMSEYHQFFTLIQGMHLTDEKDKWTVSNTASRYKVSSTYKNLMQQGTVLPAIAWLWKSCCQDKHKVFF
jgi:hypothetical protein